ncbi:hypothetical protein H4S01_000929 [Coemansia sp. RSA 2610]|nr:hypothetical protein H4S01_000929 [Coemansia sp. RSA 2610]
MQAQSTPYRQRLARADAKHGFIPEEYMPYLGGGPFNRFALALKSSLDNEVDWACARLAMATQQAPEAWNLSHHAPFLIEAVVAALARARSDLNARGRVRNVRRAVVGDSGAAMRGRRALQRAELLATALFNAAQVGENAAAMAQDPRVAIEITRWLQRADAARVCAELLDVLDVMVPQMAAPPLDAPVVRMWPGSGSDMDPLAQVETRLWAELVRLLSCSDERALVVGAARVMVQSVAWHPQLAREILELPSPRGCAVAAARVGELVSARAAELILSTDLELVAAALELLQNTVRLEAMARALDEELNVFAQNSGSRKRARGDAPSGGDSGAQTPVFGPRLQARAAEPESAPTMLPDGLVALVALVLQQWMAAVCPPPAVPPPLAASGAAASARQAAEPQGPAQGASRPPTEPELREACTWVLLNYEFVAGSAQQPRPLLVSVNDLFSRYTIAKQGQTAPRIGRALTLGEVVRVVAAVFPQTRIQTVNMAQRPGGGSGETTVALHLRQKTQHIVPIPELPSVADAPTNATAPAAARTPNACGWTGCAHVFAGEEQALEHMHGHLRGADACRWRSCNRIPRAGAEPGEVGAWLRRHVLTHGPFVDGEARPEPSERKPEPVEASAALAALDVISRPFADCRADAGGQQQVLRLVLLGVGVVEQLQRWADRRAGARGEQDRRRVWRCGDDVLERMAFVAAQHTTPVAVYAARLLAMISKQNVV